MIAGVTASGDDAIAKEHGSLAKEVATAIATQGFHLLTGGGLGLMRAVEEEFLNVRPRTGRLISVLRAAGTEHLSTTWDKNGKLMIPKAGTRTTRRTWKPNEDNQLAEIY